MLPIVVSMLSVTLTCAHGVHSHSHTHFVTDTTIPNPIIPAAVRFPLSAISLDPTSELSVSQARNAQYMLSLNNTRLICLFTAAANLTGTYENPTCDPYDHPGYYGHFFGHYLNAMSIYIENVGSTVSPSGIAMAAKLEDLLDTIVKVQAAWTSTGEPGGYFFPRSPLAFTELEDGTAHCDPCVPYYVYHKSLAGLIDIAVRLNNTRAASIAIGLGDWVVQRVTNVLSLKGQTVWQNVLGTEWGGMNDGLNNLYRLTGDAQYLTTASAFNHFIWTSPLVVHDDVLQNFHANTHLPEVIGDLNGYTLTNNETQRLIVDNFLDILLTNHTWGATGGSNDHEWWSPPRTLGDFLNAETEETCTQYNNVKLTSLRGDVSGDSHLYDLAEKQLFNGLIGNQNLGGKWANTDSTGFHYMLPLGGGGLQKPWGDSTEGGFPCCWGTSVETFSGRYLEYVFSHSPDDSILFLNLFIPTTLTWVARGALTVTQTVGWPASTISSTTITLSNVQSPVSTFTLALRIPGWTNINGATVTLNGVPITVSSVGVYLHITRTWNSGDIVDAYFPASLTFSPVTDDRAEYAGWGAIHYGNILLAGVNETSDLASGNNPYNLSSWITRDTSVAGTLRFSLQKPKGECPNDNATIVTMKPLYEVKDESYVVYWRTQSHGPTPPISFNGTKRTVLPGSANDWLLTGGVSVTDNGQQLRSGDPGDEENNVSVLDFYIDTVTHSIIGLEFQYQVNAGYGGAGAPGGSTFSAFFIDPCASASSTPVPLEIAYTSPVIDKPAYDTCNDCYATINVNATLQTPLSFSSGFIKIALQFQNNERNLNFALPMNMTIVWM